MQNTAIVACAGAGKTYSICSRALSLNSCSLMVTYTNRGKDAINQQIVKLNNGLPSKKIMVETWFEFLLREIIKPYQSLLAYGESGPNKINSIDFTTSHQVNYLPAGYSRWITRDGNIRQNEVSNLALFLLRKASSLIVERLTQQYKSIFFDEFQDLAGHDIDVVEYLLKSTMTITLVGDPKQATFKTNEGRANTDKTGKYFLRWISELESRDLIHLEHTQVSRRFGSNLADLANNIDPSGDLLEGTEQELRDHQGIFLVKEKDADLYMSKFCATCLVLDRRVGEKFENAQSVYNFGECKGLTFDDTIIVCPTPLSKFVTLNESLKKNVAKYYIAVTRARYSIAFVVNDVWKAKKIHPDWTIWPDVTKSNGDLSEQLSLF